MDIRFEPNLMVVYNNYCRNKYDVYKSIAEFAKENDLIYEWKHFDILESLTKCVKEEISEWLCVLIMEQYPMIQNLDLSAELASYNRRKEEAEFIIEIKVQELTDYDQYNIYFGKYCKVLITGNEVEIFVKDLNNILKKN